MKLSIITVCRNSSGSIKQTIDSILAQKSVDMEYIVIDGASTDGTLDIIRNFGDGIDLVISEVDAGIADAFNKGISHAHGDIISLINSDDCLLPDVLGIVVAYFHEHPEVQVVHGDLLLFKGADFVKRVTPAGHWWYPWRLVLFNHPATFVRRQVYDSCGLFSLDFRIAMDIDIFLRWIKRGLTIRYLPKPLVAMHYGGLSDRNPFAGYRESKRAFLQNGFPPVAVNLIYCCKVILHCIGRVHTTFLVRLRKLVS